MRDPYEILGVSRSASAEEVRAAFRRLSKKAHPDMGGSHEAQVELNTAYALIINELKRGQGARANTGGARGGTDRPFEDAQAGPQSHDDQFDFDAELESLRRAQEALDERLRAMRQQAWASGDPAKWAHLTWEDIARFFGNLARGGVKGLATIFAALIGVGTLLVQANLISALVILGSAIGFFISVALKSDKGGYMSASLLLFGVATLWVPAVRAALFGWPLATISVLICLGLIFKFAQGGFAGLMTGGVLGVFLISVILDDASRQQQQIATRQKLSQQAAPSAMPDQQPGQTAPPRPPVARPQIAAPVQVPPSVPPQPRELLAAQGSVLKFVAGVSYQLKVRSGMQTSIVAQYGKIAYFDGDIRDGECLTVLEFSAIDWPSPFRNVDRLLRTCGADAVFLVTEFRYR